MTSMSKAPAPSEPAQTSEALFRHLPIDIQTINETKRRGEPIGIDEPLFFNGPFVSTPSNQFAIFGRLSQVTDWPSRETQSRMVGTIVDLRQLTHHTHSLKELFRRQVIEFAPLEHGYSVEDMRLTPVTFPDGNQKIVAIAVLYRGRVRNPKGELVHDVSLAIGTASTDFAVVSPLDRIKGTDGFKNGVFMGIDPDGISYLLARFMHETSEIMIFYNHHPEPWQGWQPQGLLPLKSYLPPAIQEQLIRLGPGTNPLPLPERNSHIALFHWVIREPNLEQPDQSIEVYRGGLIEFSSVAPPQIARVIPFALTPLDYRPELRNRPGLFTDKQVVFPVGLVRCDWADEPSYIVSYGYNDAYEHFAAASVANIVKALEAAESL